MDKDIDFIVDTAAMMIEEAGFEVEIRSFETNDGRMKYELYVKTKE